MVGDKASDVQAGINAGVRSALIGGRTAAALADEVMSYASLLEFAQSITDRDP